MIKQYWSSNLNPLTLEPYLQRFKKKKKKSKELKEQNEQVPKKVSRRSATEWLCRQRNDEISDGMGKSAMEWGNQQWNGDIYDGLVISAMVLWGLSGDGLVRAHRRWLGFSVSSSVGFLYVNVIWVMIFWELKVFFFFWWNWELKVDIKYGRSIYIGRSLATNSFRR